MLDSLQAVEAKDMQSASGTAASKPPRASRSAIFAYLRRPGVLPTAIAACSFVLYCGTLAFKFVFDDRKQVLENAAIKAWSFVPGYFVGNVWTLIDPHKAANYYRPLFLLWLKINYFLFGPSPEGWHAMSVLLQALIAVQVFWLVRRLLQSEMPAAVAALLFAVHPVHIESVAWVSGVTDPLAAAFMLGAALFFLRSLRDPQRVTWSAYVASIAFAGLALLSKEIAVTLPPLLIVTASAVRERRDDLRTWKCVSPFFALTLAYLVVRQTVLHGFVHPADGHTAKDLLLTLPSAIAFYIRQLIAPLWISPYAGVCWVQTANLRQFWIPLAICCLIILVAVVGYRVSGDRRRLRAVYAWTVLPLVPALYLPMFPPTELVHDRYLYLPSVGFSILVVMAGWRLAAHLPKAAVKFATAAALGMLALLTFQGELNWASDLLLFKYAVKMAPDNDAALTNLGIAYLENDRSAEGEAALQRALEINPDSALAALNLGHYYFVGRRYPEAERMLQRALTIDPSEEEWLVQFADVELALGKLAQAEQAVREAIRLRPERAGFHFVLGGVLIAKGDVADAQQAFADELRLHPGSTNARDALNSLDTAK